MASFEQVGYSYLFLNLDKSYVYFTQLWAYGKKLSIYVFFLKIDYSFVSKKE